MPLEPNEQITFQILMVLILAAMIVAASFIFLRARHKAGRAMAVHFGALIYGLLLGGFFSAFLYPVRMAMMRGEMEMGSPEFAKAYLPLFAIFILIFRTDILARLPFIGPAIIAYRSAMLRRNVEKSEERLNKLGLLTGPVGGASSGEAS